MQIKNLLLTLSLLFFIHFAVAQEAYVIKKNDVHLIIEEDGSVLIREQLDVYFNEERRGIIRGIPYRYEIDQRRYNVVINDLKENSGYKYKVTSQNGEKRIRIGDPDVYLTGDVSYDISYEVSNAIITYEEHHELNWNLINHNSDARSERFSVSIKFPESWSQDITEYVIHIGRLGATGSKIPLVKKKNMLVAQSNEDLPPRHGITVALKIPLNLIEKTSSSIVNQSEDRERSQLDWVINWWNALPIGLAAFLFGVWNKFEKREKIDSEIVDQSYPPEGMSPAEVGTFYDFRVNRRDLVALLPYWGNKGYISIKPLEQSEDDMYFTKLEELPDSAPEHEQYLFAELFKQSSVVLLSDLKNTLHSSLFKASTKLKRAVLEKDLYDEYSKKVLRSGWLIGGGILSVIAGVLLLVTGAISAGVGMILIGIFLIVIPFTKPKLSKKGQQYFHHLKGLYHFLHESDPDQIKRVLNDDPNYLHYIYPYVLAFGLDKSWIKKMDQFDTMSAPIWYDSSLIGHSNSFSYRAASEAMNVRTIEKVFYSTPNTSGSGSSFSGSSGGFSGGGMGGGSTSSW